MRTITLSAVLLLAAGLLTAADSGSGKLTYELSNEMLNVLTPAKAAQGGLPLDARGDSSQISVNGSSIAVAFAMAGKDAVVGVDINANGKVDPNEMMKCNNGMAVFKVKLDPKDKKEIGIGFQKMAVMGKPGAVVGARGSYFAAGVYKGSVDKVVVRLVDDNLDGKLTQDGGDAIIIGQCGFAQPLLKQHAFGKDTYEIKVAEDCSTIEFTKQADLKTGQVDCQLIRGAGCVVLADQSAGRAYDIVQTRNIPAGSYKLVYAALGNGKDQVVAKPTDRSLTYDTKDESTNTLRLGLPLQVAFRTTYNSTKNEATVMPMFSVFGAGHELYEITNSDIKGPPKIAFLEGTRQVSGGSMAYG